MAVRTVRSCDLDAKHTEEADRYVFGFGGEWFAADLCPPDAAKLEKALEPFTAVGSAINPRDAAKMVNGPGEFDPAIVRAWCQANGKQLGDRGRIPKEYVEQWRAATQKS